MLEHSPKVWRTDLQNSLVDVDSLPVYLYREIACRLWEGKDLLETNAKIRLMPKKDLSYLSTKIFLIFILISNLSLFISKMQKSKCKANTK